MKKTFVILLMMIVGLAGCGSIESGKSKSSAAKVLSSIKIQPLNNRMAVGSSVQFKAIGMYNDNSSQDVTESASWGSSTTSVATISSTGLVVAAAPGTTTISAGFGGISGTTTVTVAETRLVSIALTPPQATLAVKTGLRYTVTGFYSDNSTQDLTTAVTWSSSATSVATVTNGTATAVAPGQATISATWGGVRGSALLNVTAATLKSLAISPTTPVIGRGTWQQFVATGLFSDNTSQDLMTSVTWQSSVTSVASMDSNGKATAGAPGTTTITATCNLGTPFSQSTALTVTSAALRSIAIKPVNPTVPVGATIRCTATGTYSDGTLQDLTTSAVWNSSSIVVAKAPTDGKTTAEAAGETTLTATVGGITGSTAVTVTPVTLTGTWTGTYTIYDDALRPMEVGKTYPLQFVLHQDGGILSGTAEVRSLATGQLSGTVSGRTVQFQFPYYSPIFSAVEEDTGSAVITDAMITGTALENHIGGYNLSYSFVLMKQP